ncbi:hypothetical protein EV200_102337 [Pedobacter psychrotolerans]|uniref:Uncharacterized protein n=1 Tax=Pedobacter psychrotolerans TaxID=1843235 RepID=A0A4R2HJ04_9SPHI|nr:hypothetical protein [Pedobacter psychrotolerans]TCO28919.1 hypothetical protein EV200_102337 [Pedobacter psychrotolerans]GGE52832.1 hypothetical protein GCM10011413_18900 [Pedobacter psychrotolerans]
MEAYKFKTKVSENGTIVVPDGFDVKNKEVEVIILDEVVSFPKKMTGAEFVEKFAGVIQNIDADKAKWAYLKEKHNL